MQDNFSLSIVYKNQEKEYPVTLVQQGYTYKLIVLIDDLEICFEPDEERNFRVVAMPEQDEKKLQKIDRQLLQLLKEKIEEMLQ
jgi:hypothetical protein